jgi:hypothetical protein
MDEKNRMSKISWDCPFKRMFACSIYPQLLLHTYLLQYVRKGRNQHVIWIQKYCRKKIVHEKVSSTYSFPISRLGWIRTFIDTGNDPAKLWQVAVAKFQFRRQILIRVIAKSANLRTWGYIYGWNGRFLDGQKGSRKWSYLSRPSLNRTGSGYGHPFQKLDPIRTNIVRIRNSALNY